jgi:putative ABC transport system permease protein
MFGDIGKQAYDALRHNRRRSLLTMLGMAWGIATVVLLLAYGSGFERGLLVAFETFGGNFVAIFPGRTSMQAGGTKAGNEVRLTTDDLEYLRAEVPLVQKVSPEANKQALVAYGTRSSNYSIRGAYASYAKIRHVDVAEGGFFGEQEDYNHSRVAVLGYDVKKKLFSGQNAIGDTVRIDGISFVVVGVLKHMIQDGDDNMNGMVYIPFSTMSALRDTYHIDTIVMEYEGAHDKVVKAVRDSMAFHHGFDPKDERAVFVFDSVQELGELKIITTGIKVLLGFIGLLTLGIGGVGLMNIMLVSVTQRTREIGVEKALGARRWHILIQFLVEALVITALGGLLGVALAYLVSWTVGSLTLWSAFIEDAGEGDIHLKIDSAILIWSTAILGFVGIVSGMFPAIKASRLDPIEALRYE